VPVAKRRLAPLATAVHGGRRSILANPIPHQVSIGTSFSEFAPIQRCAPAHGLPISPVPSTACRPAAYTNTPGPQSEILRTPTHKKTAPPPGRPPDRNVQRLRPWIAPRCGCVHARVGPLVHPPRRTRPGRRTSTLAGWMEGERDHRPHRKYGHRTRHPKPPTPHDRRQRRTPAAGATSMSPTAWPSSASTTTNCCAASQRPP